MKVTDLYAEDTPQLITGPHGQVFRAHADHPSFDGPIELDVTTATVTLDEQRAPRVAATLTIVTPAAAVLAQLDPRAGVRVILEAGYIRPGGDEDVSPVFDLGLRRTVARRPGDTTTLELAGDEALVIDASPAVAATVSSPTTTGAMLALIGQAISPAPRSSSTGPAGPAVNLNPVPDRWAAVADLGDRIGARAYDDGTRTWRIGPDAAAGTAVHTIKVGAGGTVTESTDSTSRDSWFNYVQHVYRWRPTGGTDQQIVATAVVTGGPYAITGPAGKRISLDERSVPTTQADANAAAAAVLARQLTRSRERPLTAVAAWWVRPGDTVKVQRDTAQAPADELLSSVVFRVPDGLMDVTTRQLDPAGLHTVDTTTPPPDPATPSTPKPPTVDPTPPAKQTYTSTWEGNASGSYRGTGVKRTDLPGEVAQGYYGGTNGNQSAVVTFNSANSTGDETGKSISTALTGATVTRVEVFLYATHWFSYAGGTARIGYANLTAVPATFTGAKPYVSATGWKRDTGRWVTITSSALASALTSGACRAITVGPGASTSSTYYGKFADVTATSSRRPKLRITYSK